MNKTELLAMMEEAGLTEDRLKTIDLDEDGQVHSASISYPLDEHNLQGAPGEYLQSFVEIEYDRDEDGPWYGDASYHDYQTGNGAANDPDCLDPRHATLAEAKGAAECAAESWQDSIIQRVSDEDMPINRFNTAHLLWLADGVFCTEPTPEELEEA